MRALLQVEFSKSFGFVDEDSRVQFERERDDFRQRNKARDTDVEFSEVNASLWEVPLVRSTMW